MQDLINFNDPTPLYEQIEKAIKRKIKMGELHPGDPIGSQNDLSKEFKVSIITVKKALSNLANEGVLFTRVGKGTYVSELQQGKMDIARHKTIGLVLRDIKHPFFSMVVHGIEERAYELGYNILLSSSSNKIEKEESQINHFRELGVDGLIIASLSLEYRATDYIQKINNENFPYIMVSYMHDPDYWYVGTDQELGGFIATEHLIKTGYNSIGYVHIGKGNLLSDIRKNGYNRALSNNALVKIKNQYAPVIGIISMNLTIIDITDIYDAKLNDEVILLDDDNTILTNYTKENLNIIPNEIFSIINNSIDRIIID